MRLKHISILFSLLSLAYSCPVDVKSVCSCQNDQEGVLLQCIGQPINELIQLLLVNQAQLGLIKQLTIQQSPPIQNMTAKFFDGLYIKKLVVQQSGIQRIDPHAFDGLANTLQDLNLAHNEIREMPSDALSKLTSLLSIDLSNNSISDLAAKHALPTLKKLFEINLGTNKIGDVHKSFFDNVKNNIQSINMGHNQLKGVPSSALRGFRQLMALHLHSNKIAALDSLSFMNLPVVNLLNLASNKIKSISRQAFINVPSLRYLYLTDNNIEDVLPHQFGSFEQLEMLDMSSNRISNLTTGTFANLPQLKQLYLGNNRIIEIQQDSFANSSITVLILESNQLKEITETMFKGMASLQQLSLKENRINNVHQNAFYDTPALVMVDLSHNEIFDLAPSTFVSQPNMLLIDMSHNKILRIPYGAFGRRVVTVLLQENPLVCTEKIHMLQQGVGMLISNNEDTVCGAQKSIDKTINNEGNKIIQPLQANNSKPILKNPEFNTDFSNVAQQPPVFNSQDQDTLAAAFRQAEVEEKQFQANGGFVPQGNEHNNEPQLNPTIPSITDSSNGKLNEVIQRPTPTSTNINKPTSLSIKPLSTGANQESVTNRQPIASNEISNNQKSTSFMQATVPTSNEETTTEYVHQAIVRNWKQPTVLQPAFSLNSHTLPPSIVIATRDKLDERVDLTPSTTKNNNPQLTPTAQLNPTKITSTTTRNQNTNEAFNVDELQRLSTSQSPTPNNNVELRGDKSLPTLLIIICLSTVGVVVVAVFVGMCFVHRRRSQQQFVGSSNSSLTARSGSYYGTNTMVNQHPNTQTYISPNQFNASQMGTMQRARRNSATYATPSPINEDVYTWLYAPGPYATTNPSYPNK